MSSETSFHGASSSRTQRLLVPLLRRPVCSARPLPSRRVSQPSGMPKPMSWWWAPACRVFAAIEAKDAGASVIIVEKAKFFGGNSLFAGGNCQMPANHINKKAGVEDPR